MVGCSSLPCIDCAIYMLTPSNEIVFHHPDTQLDMRVPKACPDEICTNEWHYMPLGTIIKPNPDARLESSEDWRAIPNSEIAVDAFLGQDIASLVNSGLLVTRFKVCRSAVFFRIYIGATTQSRHLPSNKTKDAKRLHACWDMLLGSVSRRLSDWHAGEGDRSNGTWCFDPVSNT